MRGFVPPWVRFPMKDRMPGGILFPFSFQTVGRVRLLDAGEPQCGRRVGNGSRFFDFYNNGLEGNSASIFVTVPTGDDGNLSERPTF